MDHKCCTKCKTQYPATNEYFSRDKQKSDGLHSWCKQCTRVNSHKWVKENPTAQRIRVARWNAANYSELKTYRRDTKRRQAIKNPLAPRAAAAKRRARKLSSGGQYTKDDIGKMGRNQKWRCWWCGKKLGNKFHVDHRIPLSKGGTNWPNNLVLVHPHCNQIKASKMPDEAFGRLL